MACYFRKPDTIAVGLCFLPKIVKYRIYNMDDSSIGVALTPRRPSLHLEPQIVQQRNWEWGQRGPGAGTRRGHVGLACLARRPQGSCPAAGAACSRLEAASSYFILTLIATIPSARGRENNLFIFSFLACYA
jgi:hypothetical protein